MRRCVATLTLVAFAVLGTAPALADVEDNNPCKGEVLATRQHVETPVYSTETRPRLFEDGVAQGPLIPIIDANTGPFYLEVRDLVSHYYTFSLWLYQETNTDLPGGPWYGLQRGGHDVTHLPTAGSGDPCKQSGGAGQPSAPDTLVF